MLVASICKWRPLFGSMQSRSLICHWEIGTRAPVIGQVRQRSGETRARTASIIGMSAEVSCPVSLGMRRFPSFLQLYASAAAVLLDEFDAGCPPVRGFVFDSSLTMGQAAVQGAGVALLPLRMFKHDLRRERLVRPFDVEIRLGVYWLTRLKSRRETPAMQAFRTWLLRRASLAACD